jgi:hypothetical protein
MKQSRIDLRHGLISVLLAASTLSAAPTPDPVLASSLQIEIQGERFYDHTSIAVQAQLAEKSSARTVEFGWVDVGAPSAQQVKKLPLHKSRAKWIFKAPEAHLDRRPLLVSATLRDRQGRAAEYASRSIAVFPSTWTAYIEPKEFRKALISVYDPDDTIAAELTKLQIPFNRLYSEHDRALRKSDLLIIGPHALQHVGQQIVAAFTKRVAKGKRVLLLEQDRYPDDFPCRVLLIPSAVKAAQLRRSEFVTFSGPLASLGQSIPAGAESPAAMSFWGQETEAASALVGDRIEEHEVLMGLDTNSLNRNVAGREAMNTWPSLHLGTALLMHYKKGAFIADQLHIAAHLQDDPLARWWLLALIRQGLQ